MVKNIRNEVSKGGNFIFLTSESAAEPYDFDGFLRCNEGHPDLVPVWQSVYSGYRISFGYYFQAPGEWLPKIAKQFLEGNQIGWSPLHGELPPEGVAFELEAARARYLGSDYLAMGELLRPPLVSGNTDRFKTDWHNFSAVIPVNWPAVQASVWRAPDGTYAAALVNISNRENYAEITFSDPGMEDGIYQCSSVYPTTLFPEQKITVKNHTAIIKVTIPARCAGIIKTVKGL
jgi:hypothetical protein